MPGMPGLPQLGLTLGISPSSDAQAGNGDWVSTMMNPVFSDFNYGSDASGTGGTTAITGLVRDLAVGVAVALLAKWLWKYVQ
jgi:hypothetical protein